MNSFLAGFSLSFSLILAIGAQNAFVLKQGLRAEHVFWVCLVCALSDAILITLGVVGFSAIIAQLPWLEPVMRYGGALFLFVYGGRSLWSAVTVKTGLNPADAPRQPLLKTVLICLALTWLNPHVYLDTVALLGSISTQYSDKLSFGTGAVLASFVFFFALGYGARLLRPALAKPIAWRVLDGLIGLVMWVIALGLVL
jgi:L-lysine exporter family protein LysE/ArgO